MKRILIIFFILLFAFFGCENYTETGNNTNKKASEEYVSGTDFGGDIALVGKKHESGYSYLTHSNICINKDGKELFKLPNDMVAAKGCYRIGGGARFTEVPPINNYIFATDSNAFLFSVDGMSFYDTEAEFWCKYVLDSKGNILLTPEKNGYEYILTSMVNFKGMATEGYLIGFYTESSYKGAANFLKFMKIDGTVIRDGVPIIGDPSDAADWEYYGDGIINVSAAGSYGGTYDMKNGGVKINHDQVREYQYIHSVYGRAYTIGGNLFEIEDGVPEIQEFYNGKAGVYFKKSGYIAIVDDRGNFVVDPFLKNTEEIYVHDSGFMVGFGGGFEFYDFEGNLLKTVDPNIYYNYINEFSSGFFRVSREHHDYDRYDYYNVNYINAEGEFLFD